MEQKIEAKNQINNRTEGDINLPSETIKILKEQGLTDENIREISSDIRSGKDDFEFIPEKNDIEFDKICKENLDYINNPAEDEKWGNLVDPARREMLSKNYQAFQNREKGFLFKNGVFLGNSDDLAFRIANIEDLGLPMIPPWRYASGAHDSDPSGQGRLGIMGLFDILFARQNNLVSDDEMEKLRYLCPLIYKTSAPCQNDMLEEYKNLTKSIHNRIPNGSYTKNMMQIHEDHDLKHGYLLPAALHSLQPQHSDWRKLSHVGGQAIAKKVMEILEKENHVSASKAGKNSAQKIKSSSSKSKRSSVDNGSGSGSGGGSGGLPLQPVLAIIGAILLILLILFFLRSCNGCSSGYRQQSDKQQEQRIVTPPPSTSTSQPPAEIIFTEKTEMLFIANTPDLLPSASIWIDSVANELSGYIQKNQDATFQVIGYIAVVPGTYDPSILSLQRAEKIISELGSRKINTNMFEAVSGGETSRWGNNTDEESRAPNRRIVIRQK